MSDDEQPNESKGMYSYLGTDIPGYIEYLDDGGYSYIKNSAIVRIARVEKTVIMISLVDRTNLCFNYGYGDLSHLLDHIRTE